MKEPIVIGTTLTLTDDELFLLDGKAIRPELQDFINKRKADKLIVSTGDDYLDLIIKYALRSGQVYVTTNASGESCRLCKKKCSYRTYKSGVRKGATNFNDPINKVTGVRFKVDSHLASNDSIYCCTDCHEKLKQEGKDPVEILENYIKDLNLKIKITKTTWSFQAKQDLKKS